MQNSTIYHIEHIVYFMNYICEYYRKHFDRHDYIGRVWNEFKSLYIFYYVIITYKFYIEFVYWIFVQYILQMWENFTTTFVTFTSTSLLVAFYDTQRLCLFYPRNPQREKTLANLRIFAIPRTWFSHSSCFTVVFHRRYIHMKMADDLLVAVSLQATTAPFDCQGLYWSRSSFA